MLQEGKKTLNLQLPNKVCGLVRITVPGTAPELHSQGKEEVKKTFN